MTYRILFLILCIETTLSAYAERYSSNGEAFFIGAMQGLFVMLVIGIWRLIKGSKSKTKETQHQDRENYISKTIQQSLSPWEKFKADNADIAKEVEYLTSEDLQSFSEKDIFEKISTFYRMSKLYDCSISELKNTTVNIFVSKFNVTELRDVVQLLKVKSEIESQEYCISERNTMSHYIKIWLSDYLFNKLNEE